MNAQPLTGAALAAPVPVSAAATGASPAPAPAPLALPGAGATLAADPAAQAAARDTFLSAAQDLRDAIGNLSQTYVKFNVDPHSRVVSVAIVDQASGEVVRQIPSEALTRFAESWDAYVGKLLDKEA